MVMPYWGCAVDSFGLWCPSCRFQVCELGAAAGTPRAALFMPILGLQAYSGLSKVNHEASGFRKAVVLLYWSCAAGILGPWWP